MSEEELRTQSRGKRRLAGERRVPEAVAERQDKMDRSDEGVLVEEDSGGNGDDSSQSEGNE